MTSTQELTIDAAANPDGGLPAETGTRSGTGPRVGRTGAERLAAAPPVAPPAALPTAAAATATAAASVARARAAPEAWGNLAPAERTQRLSHLPKVLADNIDRIAAEVHRENGKPMAEAIAHEAVAAVRLARHHLAAAPRVLGPQPVRRALEPHRSGQTRRRPYGVVAAIGPWNIPFFIPFSQVLPALLAGNVVVLKPAEQTPGSAHLIAELLSQAGLPDGLLQVLTGNGAVGAALIEAMPDKVSFTGSVATGRSVMAACARLPIPVSLELGGVDAMIVCADADLEFTAAAAAWGATFNGGQACCSVERLIVHRSIFDALLERLADKLLRIDPRDLGPAIDQRQHETWLRHLDDAVQHGLDVKCGGDPLPGRRLEPALVHGSAEAMQHAAVWREETFGPVVAAVPFDTDDEAVALHNATPYGLTASVFSRDVEAGRTIAERLHAGVVAVNDVGATLYSTPDVPWGGVGLSGFGRSHGDEALLDATWVQVVDLPRGPAFGPKRPWWYPYAGIDRPMTALGEALGADDLVGRVTAAARVGTQLIGALTRFPKL